MSKNDLLKVAQIGKSVGLNGDMKFHISSDFTQQFKKDAIFFDKDNNEYTIESFNHQRKVIKFKNISTIEMASKLTNKFLYQSIKQTRDNCILNKDEYFYFDIIGCNIVENGELLGEISQIDRFSNSDFLLINTAQELVKNKYAKTFLIPYEDFYVKEVYIQDKTVIVQNAMDILEQS